MPDGHPTTTEAGSSSKPSAAAKMVMTHRGIPAGSPGTAGWAMAFSKLDAHIAAHVHQ